MAPSGRQLHQAMFADAGDRALGHRPTPSTRVASRPTTSRWICRPAGASSRHGSRRAARTRSPRSSATSPTSEPPRPSSVARGRGSSRRPTRSDDGSSATCTTARSSGSCRSRSPCGSCALGSPRDPAKTTRRSRPSDEAASELKLAIQELRELARGIHPAILTEAGLAAAITALAERSAVPATVRSVPDRRLPPAVEATAYFVVSEALANVAKYAAATQASASPRPRRRRRSASRSATTASAARMPRGTGHPRPPGPRRRARRLAHGSRAPRARARSSSRRSRSPGPAQGLPGRSFRAVPRADRGTAPIPGPPSAAIVCSSIGRHPADEEGVPR